MSDEQDSSPPRAQRPRPKRRPSGRALEDPLLPDRAAEDDPERWGDHDRRGRDDDRLWREVPPHHGS